MKLTLDNLKQAGAFTGAPVEKEITWNNGQEDLTATVYVRKLSYNSAIEDLKSITKKSEAAAGRISACICDENGKAVFTPEDITGEADPERGPLCSGLTWALLTVIAEVNSAGKNVTTNSGTSLSSTESAEEPLPKPKKT